MDTSTTTHHEVFLHGSIAIFNSTANVYSDSRCDSNDNNFLIFNVYRLTIKTDLLAEKLARCNKVTDK